ncbi:MAG TPA: DUF3592 domain-containing protein [Gemmatimonadales bacterium]|jgi:hypothetical protein
MFFYSSIQDPSGLWMLGVAFVVVGVMLLIASFVELSRAIDSDDWPAVDGEVVEAGVLKSLSTGRYIGWTYSPMVRYHYVVSGLPYVSDRISFGGSVSSSFRSFAEDTAARYRRMRTVKVFISPSNPSMAVLERGVHWSSWFSLAAGAFLAGVGAHFTGFHL